MLGQLSVLDLVALIGIFAIFALIARSILQLYRDPNPGESRLLTWLRTWEFGLPLDGKFSYGTLALVSVLGLFLEMLMIRWISSEIRIFAYLKNFVLIACFLGFGLGSFLAHRRVNLMATLVPLLTLTVACRLRGTPLQELAGLLGATSEVHVWGVPAVPLDVSSIAGLILGVAVTVPLFALVALSFLPFGQLVGFYLERAPDGVKAYSINVVGSLAGIGLYTSLCFLHLPPVVWFAAATVMFVVLLRKTARLRLAVAVAFGICVALVGMEQLGRRTVRWSPYQKIVVSPKVEGGEITRYRLSTNDSWYQHVVNMSPEFVSKHPDLFKDLPLDLNPYNVPYRFYESPPRVLVLGAGMGNDVAAALRNGAGRVVAVEIDPLILELGRQLHFEKPYDSPKVDVVIDDARAYIQHSTEKFDLIVFSLLDSHTTSSHFSNIRIDNYVYTVEAMRAAKKLLGPDGVFIVKFAVNNKPWIAGRLQGIIEAAFGEEPYQLAMEDLGTDVYTSGGRFFIAGSSERIKATLASGFAERVKPYITNGEVAEARLTTDDWPFFYQHAPGLPLNVILVSLILIVVTWWGVKTTAKVASARFDLHFFFLGAGFMLLEAQIVSKMALLFGTTWVVNSIVISGLLSLIVAANFVAKALPRVPHIVPYIGIFVSMTVAFLVPLESLFFPSVIARALAATAVLCLPVFFAGWVFIGSFARVKFSGQALGANLLGALVGGLVESLSFWTGLRALLIIAAVAYLASAIALKMRKDDPTPPTQPEPGEPAVAAMPPQVAHGADSGGPPIAAG